MTIKKANLFKKNKKNTKLMTQYELSTGKKARNKDNLLTNAYKKWRSQSYNIRSDISSVSDKTHFSTWKQRKMGIKIEKITHTTDREHNKHILYIYHIFIRFDKDNGLDWTSEKAILMRNKTFFKHLIREKYDLRNFKPFEDYAKFEIRSPQLIRISYRYYG